MGVNQLKLNIAGAEANIATMQSAQRGIEETAAQMKSIATQLFGDGAVIRGSAANAATSFHIEMDSASRASNDTVNGFIRAVSQAKSSTVDYDQGGFSSVFG
jgi:hypothetical protein